MHTSMSKKHTLVFAPTYVTRSDLLGDRPFLRRCAKDGFGGRGPGFRGACWRIVSGGAFLMQQVRSVEVRHLTFNTG